MESIVYSLLDSNLNELQLNGTTCSCIEKNSTTLGSDSFKFDNKIEPKSGDDGSVKLGETRIESRRLTISFSRAYPSNTTYREVENELLSYLKRTEYLKDITNNRRIPVAVLDYAIDYDKGSFQLSSDCVIELEALTPFWEYDTDTTVSDSLTGGDINDVLLDNTSSLEVPPIITLTCLIACPTVQIYVSETKQGIEINDSIFGTAGFEEMVINNIEGTLTIGGLDRTQSIAVSTGYFKLPPGSSTLKVIPDEDLDIEVLWNVREFV